jgi:geranylgeranyl reductase family protein
MTRVAVLGGGPAGAQAAETLAAGGVTTILLDEKLAWEKPCGGGLTYKAWNRYPFLAGSPMPKRWVSRIDMAAHRGGSAQFDLEHPLLMYSRRDLNAMMLERAAQAGTDLVRTRALEFVRSGEGWRIRTTAGTVDADAIIVATGARNPLRQAGTEWGPRDAMMALGYYVPGEHSGIELQFLEGLDGYVWIFPRCNHLSVGICGKGEPSASLRRRIEEFMTARGIRWKGERFYAHPLPALDRSSWRTNRLAGDAWLAAGDAAGLVDPITGEGIYYAIRSGELAAQALLAHGPREASNVYRHSVARDFTADLQLAATIAPRFYRGRFLAGSVTARMVQFTRRSERFAQLMQEMFAGTQGYHGLRRRLWRNLAPTLFEIACNPRRAGHGSPLTQHETHSL